MNTRSNDMSGSIHYDPTGDVAIVKRLTRVLSSTGKRTRFASSPPLGVVTNRELSFEETLRTNHNTGTSFSSSYLSLQTQLFESQEVLNRHALEHERSSEFQLILLAVTTAHRNDALSHLQIQTEHNRKQSKEGSLAFVQELRGLLMKREDESAKYKRLYLETRNREDLLASMFIQQQQQYERQAVVESERQLRYLLTSQLQLNVMSQHRSDAKPSKHVSFSLLETPSKTPTPNTETSLHDLKYEKELSEQVQTLVKSYEIGVAKYEAAKEGELLTTQLRMMQGQLHEQQIAHDAELLAMKASFKAEKNQIRHAAETGIARTILSKLYSEQVKGLISESLATRNSILTTEATSRSSLFALFQKATLTLSTVELRSRVAAISVESSQNKAEAGLLQSNINLSIERATSDLQNRTDELLAELQSKQTEMEMLKSELTSTQDTYSQKLASQQNELVSLRVGLLHSSEWVREVETSQRDVILIQEKQFRSRYAAELRVTTILSERDAIEEKMVKLNVDLQVMSKHSESRDRMNAALKNRLAEAEESLRGKLQHLEDERDTLSDQNSHLRQEKGLMIHKVARAQAKAEWASARKTAIHDNYEDGNSVELRKELLQLQDALEQAQKKPLMISSSTDCNDLLALFSKDDHSQTEVQPLRQTTELFFQPAAPAPVPEVKIIEKVIEVPVSSSAANQEVEANIDVPSVRPQVVPAKSPSGRVGGVPPPVKTAPSKGNFEFGKKSPVNGTSKEMHTTPAPPISSPSPPPPPPPVEPESQVELQPEPKVEPPPPTPPPRKQLTPAERERVILSFGGAACSLAKAIFPPKLQIREQVELPVESRATTVTEWINDLRDINIEKQKLDKLNMDFGSDIWNVIDKVTGSLEKNLLGLSPGMIICAVDGILTKTQAEFMKALPKGGRVTITIARRAAATRSETFKSPTTILESQRDPPRVTVDDDISKSSSDGESASTSSYSSSTESLPVKKKERKPSSGKKEKEKQSEPQKKKTPPPPPVVQDPHRHAFDDSDDDIQPAPIPVPSAAPKASKGRTTTLSPETDDDSSESSLQKPKLRNTVHTFDESDDDDD
eukprot:TRINITY_DN22145_c0_g1_i1.p1 TRINITY_DN22145_c0_g1~~TRINITY_DN22145_c0_g1_i1.p1  ORF type:complete len:1076 (+),score=242.47 TRINITY_DN22145_c0_g1_i1:57-3284(+)